MGLCSCYTPYSLDSFLSFCGHHGNSAAYFETLETLWPHCCCCCGNMPIGKEINSLKTSIWASWAKLFAEIPEFEADFRHNLELLSMMMMIVKGRQLTGFICCVFCVCLNMLNRQAHAEEKPGASTCQILQTHADYVLKMGAWTWHFASCTVTVNSCRSYSNLKEQWQNILI